ncbi:MAG: hypothetical protein U0P45_14080 [Acidimicrobiales bacterium]
MERLRAVNICGITRVIVPAYAAALVVATLTTSDAWGWVAFVATAATIAAVRRARGTTTSCGIATRSQAPMPKVDRITGARSEAAPHAMDAPMHATGQPAERDVVASLPGGPTA